MQSGIGNIIIMVKKKYCKDAVEYGHSAVSVLYSMFFFAQCPQAQVTRRHVGACEPLPLKLLSITAFT